MLGGNMGKVFVFDEASHTYTLDGKKMPSVTKILKDVNLTPDDSFYKPIDAERGRAVHHAALLLLRKDLDESTIHPIIQPYIKAFKDFLRESRFVPNLSFCELPMYDEELWYAGKPDMIGNLNANNALIDLKTGDAKMYAPYQTAGYEKLYRNQITNPIERRSRTIKRYSLRLFSDGKYRLREHDSANDWLVFRSAIVVHAAQNK
jgi:hypothetical protein